MNTRFHGFLRRLPLLATLAALAVLSGCAVWSGRRAHRASSVVNFLYPDENQPLVIPSTPELELPLRVGIAFVPGGAGRDEGFTAMQKQALLKGVADEFRALPFVQSIEVVPESYLRPAGGFANLDQLRGLLGIDVIVLVGYDQAQFTEDNGYSLAYWTIVGAYFVHGNRNDTHTLMEASVYDIRSRALLFRAPGSNQTKASVELVNVERDLRGDSGHSFAAATADLAANLHTELGLFQQRVKEGKADARIVHRPGYSGGAGAFPLAQAGIVFGVLAVALSGAVRRR